ncbi:MAG: Trp biosynthesis-associated membrane protein, partial [Actinomycetota bacterium]
MNYRKFKSYSLFAAFVLSAVILIGWSQTWFFLEVTFPTENAEGLAVSGQIAAPGLSAFGLAGFAITAALALSSVVIRRILGILLFGLGVAVVLMSISAWSDPVLAA